MTYGKLLEGLNMHNLVGEFLVHYGERFAREGRLLRDQIKNYERTFTERGVPIPAAPPRERPQVMRT